MVSVLTKSWDGAELMGANWASLHGSHVAREPPEALRRHSEQFTKSLALPNKCSGLLGKNINSLAPWDGPGGLCKSWLTTGIKIWPWRMVWGTLRSNSQQQMGPCQGLKILQGRNNREDTQPTAVWFWKRGCTLSDKSVPKSGVSPKQTPQQVTLQSRKLSNNNFGKAQAAKFPNQTGIQQDLGARHQL